MKISFTHEHDDFFIGSNQRSTAAHTRNNPDLQTRHAVNALNMFRRFHVFSILTTGLASLLFLTACQVGEDKTNLSMTDNFPYLEMEITSLQQAYAEGTLTITEVIQAYLNRIEAIDRNGPCLNAIITINPDALAIAEVLDKEYQQGVVRGPLHGIPVVLKDNIDTHDNMPTTAGSRALMHSFPLQDSFVAHKLREAGAVIIGKANLSEWANFRGEMSTSGWSGVGGQTGNPYVLDRNPCGSSSGSGAAVSANLTMIAIGTETNGSIVCPSHANGIVGIKPTVGLISRSGIIPIAYSLDIAGPMARTVTDAAITLGALTGLDQQDATTFNSQENAYTDYTQFLDAEALTGKRIGFFKAPMGRNFKVDTLMVEAVKYMESRGAEIIELDVISSPNTGSHALQVMLYEYKDGLNRYFASLGPESPIKNLDELIAFNRNDSVSLMHFNQRYLEMANEKGDLSEPAYMEALTAMHRGSREHGIDRVMDELKLDAIVAPTGSPAWFTDWINGDSFQLGSSSPAAHAGYPNITVPMGFVDELPVGISFFGKAWSEPTLIGLAYAFEQGTTHRKPPRFLKYQ
jgi:amidase